MAQSLDFQIKGLYTYSSDINGVPKGSLSIARNINVSRTNLAEARRGFDLLAYGLPNLTDRADKLLTYDAKLFAFYNGVLGSYDIGSGWSSRGSISKPSDALSIKTATLQRNLYMTSSAGVKKLDSSSGTLYSAGLPKGLNLSLTVKSGTGTAVNNNKYVAYRYVICRYDANRNLVYGGVSARETIQNAATGVTKDITVVGYLPSSGVDTNCFIQLYRSLNSTATPDDELQLCYEYPIVQNDINNGYFSIDDIVPDDLLGAYIYTASNAGESIIGDNAALPFSRDIAAYQGHMFFSDLKSPYRFLITLIAVGSPNGLQNNDDFVITDGTTTETFTAKTSPAAHPSKEFQLSTGGTPSQNIDNTARALVNRINRTSSLVYAYLLSTGENDLPGVIQLESRSLSAVQFNVKSSTRATPWSPQLASTPTSNQYAQNDVERNAIAFSKYLEPESVPLKNKFYVGSASDPITRIVALRDALFIFKAKDGTFVLRGDSEADFSVTELDQNAKLAAAESLVSLNGSIYGLFTSGIAQIDGSQVSYISAPIKDKINSLFGTALTATQNVSFGISYESDGKYILALPSSSADTYSTYQLVYDVFNETFCEWDLQMYCGFVSLEDEKLYYGPADTNKIRQERKTFTYADFADYVQDATINAVDDSNPEAAVLTVTGVDDMQIGDLLIQGDLEPVFITAVDASAGTVTVDLDQDWDLLNPVSHYAAIDCEIEWNPDFAGNPAGFKHFTECSLLFNQSLIKSAMLSFRTDTNAAVNTVSITGLSSIGGWGFGEWDEGIWGGDAYPAPIRKGVPRSSARCNTLIVNLRHRVAYSDWQLSGIALVFEPTSVKVSR